MVFAGNEDEFIGDESSEGRGRKEEKKGMKCSLRSYILYEV